MLISGQLEHASEQLEAVPKMLDDCFMGSRNTSRLSEVTSELSEDASRLPDVCFRASQNISGLSKVASELSEAVSGLPEDCFKASRNTSGLSEVASELSEATQDCPLIASGLTETFRTVRRLFHEVASELSEAASGLPIDCFRGLTAHQNCPKIVSGFRLLRAPKLHQDWPRISGLLKY